MKEQLIAKDCRDINGIIVAQIFKHFSNLSDFTVVTISGVTDTDGDHAVELSTAAPNTKICTFKTMTWALGSVRRVVLAEWMFETVLADYDTLERMVSSEDKS